MIIHARFPLMSIERILNSHLHAWPKRIADLRTYVLDIFIFFFFFFLILL